MVQGSSRDGHAEGAGPAYITLAKAAADRVRANVGLVIVGKDEAITLMLVALLCQGHILIEDVPGIGKTTLAKAFARSLGCSFKRIQFTPDLMPADITGINFYNQKEGEFQFRPGPIIAQVVLGDEINRATPRTQAALLEAMQEAQITVDGATIPLPQPFMVLATENPIELEGTFPLPEAELDRFLLRVRMGYPTRVEERSILLRFQGDDPLEGLHTVVASEEVLALQKAVQRVRMEDSLVDYVVQLCQATREHPSLALGASPRASLSLFRAARAWAALAGRDYTLPDDVKAVASAVLVHRLILTSQTRLRGRTTDEVLGEVLESVAVPV
ncbi:MAG: MoxR family ATPase [Chloroflexi bacterium]|nr:MoxR family ATPase [Chloroflexota bacterium]